MASTSVSSQQGFHQVRERLLSAGPVALAFLAGQHHAIHMALLAFLFGSAGMSFMTMYPMVRRVMLAVSLLVAGWLAYQAMRPGRPRAIRVTQAASVVTTLALVGWSLIELGP